MFPPDLDIVVPCYNPSVGWVQQVLDSHAKICSLLPGVRVGLLIVNDGSKNNLETDFQLLKETIPTIETKDYSQNMGKGYAVRTGVALSEAEVVIYTDVDFPYDEEGIIRIYHQIANGRCDIALAVRDENYYDDVPFFRKVISKVFKKLVKATLRVPTTDTQAGLKGFNKKGREIFLSTTINRYLFDLEFVWLASNDDIKIDCLQVKLKNDVTFSRINLSVLFGESLNLLKIIGRK